MSMLVGVMAILGVIGESSYNLGLNKGYVSVVAPIAGSYATLMVALSYLVFKDPIHRQQKIGIVVGLVGIVMLALLSK